MAGRVTHRITRPSIAVLLGVVTLFAATAMAQSSCSNALASLSPCLGYMTGNANIPSKGCCSGLASVVQTNATCLCQIFTSNNLGFPVNQTRALALPAECKVTAPPVSQCQGVGGPTASPSGNRASPSTPGSNPTATSAATGIFMSSVAKVLVAFVLAAILS